MKKEYPTLRFSAVFPDTMEILQSDDFRTLWKAVIHHRRIDLHYDGFTQAAILGYTSPEPAQRIIEKVIYTLPEIVENEMSIEDFENFMDTIVDWPESLEEYDNEGPESLEEIFREILEKGE